MKANTGSRTPGIVAEMTKAFQGGHAHVGLQDAVKDLPANLRGATPQGLPYSVWQIVEHIRIAQRDILDFSRNGDNSYKPLRWPADYWPQQTAPPSETAWEDSLLQIASDRKEFEALLKDMDEEGLTQQLPWGDGQTLLHEALLILDHEAYHTGEIVVLRRLLGAWK